MLTSETTTTNGHEAPEANTEHDGELDYMSFAPRRRWPLLLAGIVVGAAGAFVAQQLLADPSSDAALAEETVEVSLVAVTTTDLIEEVEWSGELAYGSEVSFNGGGGVITAVTPVGTIVEQGDNLLEEDRVPRTVLYGSVPPYRTMTVGDEGPDVLQLEENLVSLGYDTANELNVDGVFSDYTATLVARWQLAIGTEETGEVTPESIAVVAGPSIIRTAPVVGSNANGSIVTVAASEDLRVTVPVDVTDADDWSPGQVAQVELVDGYEVAAVVDEVGTQITTDNSGSTVDVVLRLSEESSDVPEGPVTVVIAGDVVADAIVVPTRALIALQEGGFAVQKSVDGGTRLVGVEVGTFDDGLVQITEGDLVAGDQVVVPG